MWVSHKTHYHEKKEQRNGFRMGLGGHAQSALYHRQLPPGGREGLRAAALVSLYGRHDLVLPLRPGRRKIRGDFRPSGSLPFSSFPLHAHYRPQRRLFHAAIPVGHSFGIAKLVSDEQEKITALRAICQRFLSKHMDAFDEAVQRSLHRTAVVRIRLSAPPTGKRKQYDKEGEEMKFGRME